MIKKEYFIFLLLILCLNTMAQTNTNKKDLAVNKIKLSSNYTFGYGVNAFIVGADFTKIRGFLVQLDYYRNIHKRIAIGISAGYAKGVDRNNPELDLLDYEISKYAYFIIQGFAINNLKNRLYLKIGSGYTHTDRLHSTVRVSPWHQERGLQYSNSGGLGGFYAEVCYDRQITNNIFIGLNIGVLAHNDGANYAGCAMGYAF